METKEKPLRGDKEPVASSTENTKPSINYEKLASDCQEAIEKAAEALTATDKVKSACEDSAHSLVLEDDADVLDDNLKARSENAYIEIAKEIVKSSTTQLQEQNQSKNLLKKTFTIFFIALISVQYIALAVLLFIRAFQKDSILSDTVIVAYISSVFLETLGAVIIMIRYAFASDQETEVLEILNSVIDKFKKFSD